MANKRLVVELDAKTNDFVVKMQKAEDSTERFGNSAFKASETSDGMGLSMGRLGSIASGLALAVVGATTAIVAYANAQSKSMVETEAAAKAAGVTAEEFRRMSFAFGTVGVDAKNVGDIFKDINERIGEFVANGGGELKSFFEVMGMGKKEALSFGREIEKLSGPEVLQKMVNMLEGAGKSSKQITFALESLGNEAVRLYPILSKNGEAAKILKEKFDEMQSPLTDKDVEQFKLLGQNVDLAQIAFVNMLNKGVAPFLPKINQAITEIGRMFKIVADQGDVGRLLSGDLMVEDITNVEQLKDLIERTNATIKGSAKEVKTEYDVMNKAILDSTNSLPMVMSIVETAFEKTQPAVKKFADEIKRSFNSIDDMSIDVDPSVFDENAQAATKSAEKIIEKTDETTMSVEALNKKLEEQLAKINAIKDSAASGTSASSPGVAAPHSGMSEGERQAKLEELDKELKDFSESKKTELEVLKNQYNERLALNSAFGANEENMTKEQKERLKLIQKQYYDGIKQFAMTEKDAQQEAAQREMESITQLYNEKLISEEQYQARLLEIRDKYAPELSDPSVLSDKASIELEMLQEQLEMQLISWEDYYSKLDELKMRSGESNERQFSLTRALFGMEKKEISDAFKVNKKFSDLTVDQKENAVRGAIDASLALFDKNKGVQAGMIVMDTAQNVVQSVKNSGGVPWGLPSGAAAAAMGIAQLNALKSANSNGGGSISASGSASPQPATPQNFVPETSGLEVSDRNTQGTAQTIRIELATDSGDDLMVALARGVNRAQQQGRV